VRSVGPLVFTSLVFVGFYLLAIRPQQRRFRALQQVQTSLVPGRRVMTTAGLYGTVTSVEDDVVGLEVAPGVELRWARAAVARTLDDDAPTTD
jgi:preprotein translocase subunit YajC